MDGLAILLASISLLITIAGGAFILMLLQRSFMSMQAQQQQWQQAQIKHQQNWELRQEQRMTELATRLTAEIEAGKPLLDTEHELARIFRVDELPLTPYTNGQRQPMLANWRPPILYKADLSGRDLSNHSFRRADLREARLVGTNFFLSDLTEASLSGADLSGADLTGANLTRADLRKSNLRNANLLVADLHGAILIGANLLGARNLTSQQLETAIYDETTQLDEGFQPLEQAELHSDQTASSAEVSTEQSPPMETASVPETPASLLVEVTEESVSPQVQMQQPDQLATPVDLQPDASQPVIEAYCVRCKKKVEMQNPQQVTLKNNRTALQGTCPFCGTKLFRIGQF